MRNDVPNWTFHIIRHAECTKNTDDIYIHGRMPESPLTPLGQRQAAALGKRFRAQDIRFDRVYASPFVRTMDTAGTMLAGMKDQPQIIPVEALIEYSAGDWAGRKRVEVYTPEMMRRMAELGIDFAPPGGESIRMVERRASEWLESILQELHFLSSAHGHIAIVTHGITTKALLHYVLGTSDRMAWRVLISNTGITRLRYTPRGWFVDAINDTAHLPL